MITITHNRATFTVKPENAQQARELLALIDKTNGQKGAKPVRVKGQAKHDSSKRDYPAFYPGMETGEYLNKYHELNEKKMLSGLSFTFANRPAPMLDAREPEVLEELDPDYEAPAAKPKQTLATTRAAIHRALCALALDDVEKARRILQDALL
jgi:hypothetical protein